MTTIQSYLSLDPNSFYQVSALAVTTSATFIYINLILLERAKKTFDIQSCAQITNINVAQHVQAMGLEVEVS